MPPLLPLLAERPRRSSELCRPRELLPEDLDWLLLAVEVLLLRCVDRLDLLFVFLGMIVLVFDWSLIRRGFDLAEARFQSRSRFQQTCQ